MASSKWYYSQYATFSRKGKNLKGKRAELEKIRDAIAHDPIYSAPEKINRELNDALEEHADGMQGDAVFYTNYSLLESKKESGVFSDANVYGAYNAINTEILTLTKQINNADSQTRSYFQKYSQAVKEEMIAKVTGG